MPFELKITGMRIRFITFLLITLLFAAGVTATTVRIAVTSDIHGALFPYDFLNGIPGSPSLASVKTFADSVRALPGANLILLDNGDLIQGTPAAYYANFVAKSRMNLFARVMNYMQYDAATAGNHDIEAGPAIYYRLQREFSFPWLGANIIRTETGKPAFEPYTIIERSGIRIAVLGLITPGVPGWLPATLWPGLRFDELVESAKYWTSHIQEQEKPDAIIGLFHTGMGQQNPGAPGDLPENAGWMAALQVPGLDLVILGHDHRPRAEKVTSLNGRTVAIVNPGSGARNVGYAELLFSMGENGNFKLVSAEPRVVPLENTKPSATFESKFRKDIRAVRKYAEKPVATLKQTLEAGESLFGSSAFTDLIHEAQLAITGADISITAPLTTSGNLDQGTLLVRDLFKLYRYENYLYVMELTGREILDFLEYSGSLWFNQMKDKNDHLLNFRRDAGGNTVMNNNGQPSLANPSFNFDSAAGIIWHLDLSKPAGNRVTIHSMEDGSPFSEEKVYKAAINSYRGSGGGGHLTAGAGIEHGRLQERIVKTSETDIRSMLIHYFRRKGIIDAGARNNWKLVPEEWYQAGREKDMMLMSR